MTNALILSHKDSFSNLKLIEKNETLDSKQVYGFGVQGRHFVLIKSKNSFFSKIWFSFLKFFRFVKVDKASIERLKQATLMHIEHDDYKEWAVTKSKVTKVGIQNLMTSNKALQGSADTLNQANQDLQSQIEGLTTKLSEANTKISSLKAEIKKLQDKSQDKPQESQESQDNAHKELKAKLETLQARKAHYKQKWEDLKKVWELQNPDKTAEESLKEYKKMEKKHSHKSLKKKQENVVNSKT